MDSNPFIHTHTHLPLNNVVEETVLLCLASYFNILRSSLPPLLSRHMVRATQQRAADEKSTRVSLELHNASCTASLSGLPLCELVFRTLALFLMSTHLTACSGLYYGTHRQTQSHTQTCTNISCKYTSVLLFGAILHITL